MSACIWETHTFENLGFFYSMKTRFVGEPVHKVQFLIATETMLWSFKYVFGEFFILTGL